MFRLTIVTEDRGGVKKLHSELLKRGFSCSVIDAGERPSAAKGRHTPDLVLLATDGRPASPEMKGLAREIKQERRLPIIALISRKALGSFEADFSPDDFVIEPWETDEVIARVKRTMHLTSLTPDSDLIKCDNLVIDLTRCEVRLDNRIVSLTFREYELLRFLAGNRGKVFTRDALLDRVWGYDYYGGDRTVDVHIRRLRSKIEDSNHIFIETVRNIGYRFRKES
ncbi:MAG: response regulator transcription factor [Dehalococcoidales bacterium]|nr:response regulator transcription factor [Dehalococcoidales bacterium]